MVALLGPSDEVLRVIERTVPSDLHVRGNEITITGGPARQRPDDPLGRAVLEMIAAGQRLTPDAVGRVFGMLTEASTERPADVLNLSILSRRGKTIRPKTLNQKHYVDAIDQHTIVFGIGRPVPARRTSRSPRPCRRCRPKQVNRIILTRPAVEAGERLGFLPGTLYDKIDPYLRPLLDRAARHGRARVDPAADPGRHHRVAPLAYMRGRTLNDAFIILDEAQNTTAEQMKMFLTRLGFGSRMVVTGDVTQIDLPGGTAAGSRSCATS